MGEWTSSSALECPSTVSAKGVQPYNAEEDLDPPFSTIQEDSNSFSDADSVRKVVKGGRFKRTVGEQVGGLAAVFGTWRANSAV